MGYYTYRLFRDVTLEQLGAKVEANLALHAPGSKGAQISVTGFQGDGCSALLMGYLLHEEAILRSIGYQLDCVWMDVRYQEGDSWDLTLMRGSEQLCNHGVNPWAYGRRVDYHQDHIDYRIDMVCESWPRQGEILRPYLLPWRVPRKVLGWTRYIPRDGKACASDQYGYGNADQIEDFIRRFGIEEGSPKMKLGNVHSSPQP